LYILDTNHISVLERRGDETTRLLARLAAVSVIAVHVSIVSYEEQIRVWANAIAGAKSSAAQVSLYQRLHAQLENYCNLSILQFDEAAAAQFDVLRKLHRRTSAPDLKIAAITMVNRAVLLTQNERDFRNIEGLVTEDWTR
jgi:tRNA(fMet)-specific endonuclease VapC